MNNYSSLESNDIKISDKTISDKESKEEIESKTEDMNKSQKDLKIKRFRELKVYDLIEIHFSEIDFEKFSKDFNWLTQMWEKQSFSDENHLKKRGEEDTKKSLTAQESNDIMIKVLVLNKFFVRLKAFLTL